MNYPPSCRFPPLREGNHNGVRFPLLREGNHNGVQFPLLREGNHNGVRFPLLREGNRNGVQFTLLREGNLKEGVITAVFCELWLGDWYQTITQTPQPSSRRPPRRASGQGRQAAQWRTR